MNSFETLKAGDSVFVQSYKHNGSLHRTWSKALVIDVLDNCAVVVTDHTWVVESDGRRWLTKEPAICFYYSDRWYNVISMVRKTGIFYYCNIASPSLYDGEAIKNIDYDLDIKVFPDGSYAVLDENEYHYHAGKMHYPQNIRDIVEGECQNLQEIIKRKEKPFDLSFINDYLMKYFGLIFDQDEVNAGE